MKIGQLLLDVLINSNEARNSNTIFASKFKLIEITSNQYSFEIFKMGPQSTAAVNHELFRIQLMLKQENILEWPNESEKQLVKIALI